MRKKQKSLLRKSFLRLKGKSNVTGLMASVGVLAAVGLFMLAKDIRLTSYPPGMTPTEYTCCDSGDGAACHPSTTETIMYNGATYGLLKTNIFFVEKASHLVDKEAIPGKGRIIINDSQDLPQYKNEPPPCSNKGPNGESRDLIGVHQEANKALGLVNKRIWCDNIKNDQVIYLCKETSGTCGQGTGSGTTDAYFRLSDLAENNGQVPTQISNCRKPVSLSSNGKQEVVTPTYPDPGKKNLQLETFYIRYGAAKNEWLSPYCKPAIYLYPKEKMFVNVKVTPKGALTYTLPQYPANGWTVLAHPDGKILSQTTYYDYLYYETQVSDEELHLPDTGFVFDYGDLNSRLFKLVRELGLNENEARQFTDYWVHVLPNAPYYQVKIVAPAMLDNIAPLLTTPRPKTVIRVTLHFTALDTFETLPAPIITPVNRTGFTLVEWGGIFKKDKTHPFSCFM